MSENTGSLKDRIIDTESDDFDVYKKAKQEGVEPVWKNGWFWAGVLIVGVVFLTFALMTWAKGDENPYVSDYGVMCRSEAAMKDFIAAWDGKNEQEVMAKLTDAKHRPQCAQVYILHDGMAETVVTHGPTGLWRIVAVRVWSVATMEGLQQHFAQPMVLYNAVRELEG